MPKYILCDIEGTTTSIAFVHEVLFPYALAQIGDFVRTHAGEPATASAIADVRETLEMEKGMTESGIEQVVEALEEWIRADRKHTALKEIQGLMWRNGYESGNFTGHVYPDVPGCFEAWKGLGIAIGIYSSGSVEAQKLLFRYSDVGDLCGYFSHHFDTRTGHKREVESYRKIAEVIGLQAGEILFLSDVEAELDAAQAAGMQVLQLLRPGAQPSERHAGVSDFHAVPVEYA